MEERRRAGEEDKGVLYLASLRTPGLRRRSPQPAGSSTMSCRAKISPGRRSPGEAPTSPSSSPSKLSFFLTLGSGGSWRLVSGVPSLLPRLPTDTVRGRFTLLMLDLRGRSVKCALVWNSELHWYCMVGVMDT